MRIVFIGTGDIGLPSLEFLLRHPDHQLLALVAQPDKPAGRKQELLPPPTKTLALAHGIPVLQPAKIRTPDSIAAIQALEPDLIVVMAYGQILPKALLEIPKIACLNLHASLLPRHRGAAPIQAAIEAGDAESGVTVMYMDEGLDTGDILLAKSLTITPGMTGGELHDALAKQAPEALAEALDLLVAGKAPRIAQDNAAATYASKLSREHGHIDWSRPVAEIERKIRALNPWPGCYAWLPADGTQPLKLKIHAAVVCDQNPAQTPGQIRATHHELIVSAVDGALHLTEIQLEGKRRMRTEDFLRGHTLASGTLLK